MSPEPPPADVLILPAGVARELLAHARAEAPNEACGLLSGSLKGGTVAEFHPLRNALASPYRFDIHPADLVRVLAAIEDAGVDLVAIFHSHPRSPAVPSALDRRESRYPVPYLIASLSPDPPELRAWSIQGNNSFEVTLRVGGASAG